MLHKDVHHFVLLNLQGFKCKKTNKLFMDTVLPPIDASDATNVPWHPKNQQPHEAVQFLIVFLDSYFSLRSGLQPTSRTDGRRFFTEKCG